MTPVVSICFSYCLTFGFGIQQAKNRACGLVSGLILISYLAFMVGIVLGTGKGYCWQYILTTVSTFVRLTGFDSMFSQHIFGA